jgi:hypothetical protein
MRALAVAVGEAANRRDADAFATVEALPGLIQKIYIDVN